MHSPVTVLCSFSSLSFASSPAAFSYHRPLWLTGRLLFTALPVCCRRPPLTCALWRQLASVSLSPSLSFSFYPISVPLSLFLSFSLSLALPPLSPSPFESVPPPPRPPCFSSATVPPSRCHASLRFPAFHTPLFTAFVQLSARQPQADAA